MTDAAAEKVRSGEDTEAPVGEAGGAGRPRIPLVPLALGLAGLIPFWALAVARTLGLDFGLPQGWLGSALAAYAATILAFLGGIRWGLAVGHRGPPDVRADYVLSVVPQLIGWAALALSDRWRFVALGIVVLALGPIDRNLVSRGIAPAWFGRLRGILSVGAGAALLLAALA